MLLKMLKILGIILLLLLLIGFIFYQYMFRPSIVEEPELAGNLHTETLMVDGHKRTFNWYQPSNSNKKAILFILHGSTGDGPGIRQQTAYAFDQLAEEEGFIPVYPTGYFNHWNDCRGTADYQANKDDIDDITFLKKIENHIAQQLGNSFDYRFAMGHSNGGHFCFKLAFEAPNWINGIVPVSANIPVAENLDCTQKGQFVPMFLINGTADKVNPYEGGLVVILGNDSRGTVVSTDRTMQYWSSLAGCTTEPSKKDVPNNNTADKTRIEQYYWQCGVGNPLQLFKVVNGGHTIPHTHNSFPRILGATNQDVDIAREVWGFFSQVIQ